MKTAVEGGDGDSLPLETIRAVLSDHPVELAIVFGSHATGQTHEGSDIDIAVEFAAVRPSDPAYNETFFGVSADLSEQLETDDVDLVDLHAASSALASAICEHGLLVLGAEAHATEVCRDLTQERAAERSPRDRFDDALASIDDHLHTDGGTYDDLVDSSRHCAWSYSRQSRPTIRLVCGKLRGSSIVTSLTCTAI